MTLADDPGGKALARPRFNLNPNGTPRVDEFNAQMARQQVQLTYYLVRLGLLAADVDERLTEEEQTGANFSSGQIVAFETKLQNVVVSHTLDRVPIGYLRARADGAVVIYDGDTPWTKNEISFRSDTNNVQCEAWIY